jgi:hypothetical protein
MTAVAVESEATILRAFPFTRVLVGGNDRDLTAVEGMWRVDVVGWEGEDCLLELVF